MNEKLSIFLTGLFDGGTTVAAELHPFTEEDEDHAITILRKYYERSLMDMPSGAPDFDKGAALWAAKYIYRAFQLLLLRQLDVDNIERELTDYPSTKTPAVIYSSDLTLRNLPLLITLAKRLAPDDPLVTKIKETAAQWPFSSVSAEIEYGNIDCTVINECPFLKILYADRIIEARDIKRALCIPERELVLTVLGSYAGELWQDFETSSTQLTYGK